MQLRIAFAVAALAAPLAVAACSSASSSAQSPGDAGDAGVGDDAPDYHDVYPAPHPPIPEMKYFGGRVIKSPELVTVTFVGMDTSVRDYLRDFGDKIATTAWWSTVMNGFGVGQGSGGVHVELPDTFSGTNTTDDQVQSYIAQQITMGKLPAPSSSTIYLLYMPYNAIINLSSTDQSCQTFGGYHGSGVVATDGGSQRFLYAILDDCRGPNGTPQQIMDDQTYVASHEIAEAATDPDVNTSDNGGWYMPAGNDAWVTSRAGGENADLCNGQSAKEGMWTVTRVWNVASVAASGAPCVPSPTPWYFNAPPVTENPSKDQGVGPNAGGYIVVRRGETRDVEVDVFSTQPLPGDLKLAVGHFITPVAGMPYDPAKSVPIYGGVTSTLSQTTARNGDRVKLTIAVDPTLHSLTKRFFVRAILSDTDYHSWPVVLYVP